ncbi:MAG: hypothetical protein EOP64_05685, partial [Sphingomonas sp.]
MTRPSDIPADLEDHNTPEIGFPYSQARASFIDSVGEKKSDYTFDSDSGLFVPRMADNGKTPASGTSPREKGKAPAASDPKTEEPEVPSDDELPDAPAESTPPPTAHPRGSVKIDGDVYFSGKPEELPKLWFHMFEKSALDPNMDTDTKKCAYLATRFTGAPRQWLIDQHEVNALMFTHYQNMVELINQKYSRDRSVQTQIDQKRFDSLRQTGDAATFVHEFNLMADRM